MKRFQIFLGLTAGLLATAVYVSAKSKFLAIPTCYKMLSFCFPDTNSRINGQTLASGAQLFTLIHNTRYGLYTNVNDKLHCTDPIYAE